MEGFWQMLSIQMLLFVYMAIGYGLRKGKILKAERGMLLRNLSSLLPCRA